MANYRYSADLVNDILFRAGEPIDGTSDFDAVALQYLNRAYQALWAGGAEFVPEINERWWWLKKHPPGILTLEPVINTGTLAVTNNSASITFSSAPAGSLVGWFIKVKSHADVFRIKTHTGGQVGATLESVYTGDTGTTAGYDAYKLEYELASDLLYIVAPMRVFQDNRAKIDGMSLDALEFVWPLGDVNSGVPKAFAMVTETKVRFSHYGGVSATDYIKVEYDYLYRPADLTDSGSEEPVVPRRHRKTLSDLGLFSLFMDKNDDRADGVGLMAKAGLKAMAIENRSKLAGFGDDFGRIITRQDVFRPDVLRTSSGLIIG